MNQVETIPMTVADPEATQWQRFRAKYRLYPKLWLGKLYNALGFPGRVQEFDRKDAVSGVHLKITNSPLFTVISIDGRDFYFYRLSGKFDGTGSCVGAAKGNCDID